MNRLAALRPEYVGKWNEREVLRMVQVRGPLSRAELARLSGLSPPTVSRAIASLLRSGLLEETSTADNARGRPAVNVRLATETVQVLAAVVDAELCEVVCAGLDGEIHRDAISFATPKSYPRLRDQLLEACRTRMNRPGIRTLGVGLSLPGLIDDPAGRSVLSPNVPCTNGQTPALDLARSLELPAALVQESRALGLAERHYGAAVGIDDFASLDLGVGVGMSIWTNGQLLGGSQGFAGELGHIPMVPDGGRACGCGRTGCLETLCNESAFAERIAKRAGETLDFEASLRRVQREPNRFQTELAEAVEATSLAIATVINLFNPSTIFVHSRQFDASEDFFGRVCIRSAERALPPSAAACRIARATGTKRLGAVAAIVQHLTNAVATGAG